MTTVYSSHARGDHGLLRRTASDGPTSKQTPRTTSRTYASPSPLAARTDSSPFQVQDDGMDGEALAGRFQMLEELGSGSFGVVYKAIEKATGEIVAIKHVDLESSEEDLSDILSELAVLSSCSSTHITKYKLAFLRHQTLWIVMEYLGGGSCADLLKPPPHHLTESHIAIICRELLLGLAYLHGEGKLHRDIKAANVLLGMDGRVKLADFGVAAQLTGLKSMRNTFVGTPFWMAPEVIQQEGHDSKADIWSLGITAMELANGQPPHATVHPMKVLFLIPKQSAPRLEDGNWSKDFRDFVATCLTKDSDFRPSAKQLLKHRFIRHAGKIEGLQELIQKKQEWEDSRDGERKLKYYAETLKQLKVPMQASVEDDDWLFETVKAVPNRRSSHNFTQRRRKTPRNSDVSIIEDSTAMMDDLVLDKGTARRVSGRIEAQQHEANSSVRRSSTRNRRSSTQRLPLGVNMSFGNSPSVVRQFRRVSQTTNAENDDPLRANMASPLKLDLTPQYENKPLLSLENYNSPLSSSSPSARSQWSSQASTLGTTTSASGTKQEVLGRELYSSAIGISCQNVLNETGEQDKREAVSRVAEAISDLEAVDPAGLYHIMQNVIDKILLEPKLREMLPLSLQQTPSQQSSANVSRCTSRAASNVVQEQDEDVFEDTGTVQRTPRKPPVAPQGAVSTPSGPNSRNASPAKLVLAQNNPHLKSHRRRQSTQVVGLSRENSQAWSSSSPAPSPLASPVKKTKQLSKKELEEEELDKLIKGQGTTDGMGGMLEHTKAMADVMFERWCEGLRVRWPAV